ncbi:hypothetical protein ACQPZ2_00630 [Nocardia pseudovaccinii]|uniref:hypothetical protein n=1 Tax=Nocardia pseudovaccinii TaxID=189540 RepID=UPI003D8D7502
MVIAAAGHTLTAASACSSVVDHFNSPYDPGTAKVGDCFGGKHQAIGGGTNLSKTVSCGNPEGYYQVSAVLGNGKSAECPSDRSPEGYFSGWCRSRLVQHQLLRDRREDFLPALAQTEFICDPTLS